jgi:hypothetical protein
MPLTLTLFTYTPKALAELAQNPWIAAQQFASQRREWAVG